MIPPPPPPIPLSTTTTNSIPNHQQQLPPPPPTTIPKFKITKKEKKEEPKTETLQDDTIIENKSLSHFVVDESLVVKDLYLQQSESSPSSVDPLTPNTHHHNNVKVLIVTSYSRPNQSAKTLNAEIEKSISMDNNGRCPEIVLTHELWLAGRLLSTPDRKIVMNNELDSICQVMKQHKCYGFIGSRVWGVDFDMKPRNSHYNCTIVINPNGEVLGCYRKRVPTSAESSTPGDQIGMFDTIYGRIAVLICFDIENQLILEEVLAYKPFLILNPTHIGGSGLNSDNTSSKNRSVISMENDEKSRRFQVKIALEALGRNFEKLCHDHHVNILRCDTPVHYGGRGTHQLMTPYSTIYPPSFYAENSFSFHVDLSDQNDSKNANDFSHETEAPERERTHNEDNVGPRYTLFSNLHQHLVLRSSIEDVQKQSTNAANFKIRFFNHNRLICCDSRRITFINTDIIACENFSLDHVAISIDKLDGKIVVNHPSSMINNNDDNGNNDVVNDTQIADIWAIFESKQLIVLMSDGTVGVFKVLEEERLKISNQSILLLEKQFKVTYNCSTSSSLDHQQVLRIIGPSSSPPTNNSLSSFLIVSRRNIIQLDDLNFSSNDTPRCFKLDYECCQPVNISATTIEYLSVNGGGSDGGNVINLIELNMDSGVTSLKSSATFDSESVVVKVEPSLESNSFILTEFTNNNMTHITPFKVQNNQIVKIERVKLPDNLNISSIISLNSTKFICGQLDGTLKLLDLITIVDYNQNISSSQQHSLTVRHHFHPYPITYVDNNDKNISNTKHSLTIRHHFHPYPIDNAAQRVVSLIHDQKHGRLISIHQHKTQPNEHMICMAKFGNNRFVANLTTLFQ